MAILFVGSRAIDLGGASFKNTTTNTFDSAYSSESAKITAPSNGGSNGFTVPHALAASNTTWYHFYVKTANYMTSSGNDGYWFTIYNDAGDELARWDILNGQGFAKVTGDTIVEGTTLSLPENSFVIIDVKVVVDANITMEAYMNGALQSTATAANTAGKLGPTSFVMQHEDMVYTSAGDEFYYSEFVVTDNEPTLNWRVATLVPAAQGTHNEWNGTYADIVTFGDGLSINSPTPNQKESWTLSVYGGPATTSGVRAVVNSFIGAIGSAGPTQITPFIRHAATDVDGTPFAPTGSLHTEVLENNPQTAAPWDTADFATLEVGVKSTA